MPFPKLSNALSSDHQRRLRWFYDNTGTVVGWPINLEDGTLLANKAKGIYKPEGNPYALSVKQTLASPYADKEPVTNADGSWSYLYFQEEQVGKDPEELSTNRAMRMCMRDGVPIGVLRQLLQKPNVRYKVLGLANILGKAAGYYLLEGILSTDAAKPIAVDYARLAPQMVKTVEDFREDNRIYKLKSVVQRQGQPQFRERLMEIYERRCAISTCDVTDVLEAAHILPYRGQLTNDVSNGIILRADIHILFDEGLLCFDPQNLQTRLSPVLQENMYYRAFNGVPIHRGKETIDRELLRAHQHYCGF